MNIQDFLKTVYAATNRQADSFIVQGIDVGLFAANAAKLWAQNEEDFEYCRKTVVFQVDKNLGVDLDTAVLFQESALATPIPVSVKRLTKRACFVQTRDGTSYLGTPLDVYSRDADTRNWKQNMANNCYPITSNSINIGPTGTYLVQHGTKLYLNPTTQNPAGSTVEVAVDAYIYLPDYDTTVIEDFFIRECRHWMMWRTVWELDNYLKEDSRIPLVSKIVDNCWNNVLKWNNYLVSDMTEKDLS